MFAVDDEPSETVSTQYAPPSVSASAPQTRKSSPDEYGNVFAGAEYGVIPSNVQLHSPAKVGAHTYVNLPVKASDVRAAATASPAAQQRRGVSPIFYDKWPAPLDRNNVHPGYDVVQIADGRGYDAATIHDDQSMQEDLEDVSLTSGGSSSGTSTDSSAERLRKGSPSQMQGAGRNQYESIASRLTLSPLPVTPPTMRAPPVPSSNVAK